MLTHKKINKYNLKKTSSTFQSPKPNSSLSLSHLFLFGLRFSLSEKPSKALLSFDFCPIFFFLTMKKLYRRGTVHPSPPITSDHLSFLPATILTLTVALSPEDREVLAYLLSSSCSNYSSVTVNFNGSPQQQQQRNRVVAKRGSLSSDHPPQFNCNCFRCYTSYWVRWDESPNRQVIHEIIDAFEAELAQTKTGKSGGGTRKERRNSNNKRGCNNGSSELKGLEASLSKNELTESDSVSAENSSNNNNINNNCGGEGFGGDGEEGLDKGSVRRFVSFIGERIWGVWSQ